ncbi:hypothetical protein AX15_006788 [Amanita polypyramis BW_CC]|nr:hypothetical protein AX15_006788 [Amanita polypyramis BW_CC]
MGGGGVQGALASSFHIRHPLIMSNPRRKIPKSLPRLPPSAFTPPNASSGDSFPLAPVTHSVHPAKILDANVIINDDDINLTRWFREAGPNLTERIAGVVLTLSGTEEAKIKQILASRQNTTPIISLAIPFDLQIPVPSVIPTSPDPSIPISFSTVFYKTTPEAAEALKWALQVGRPVDINIPDASEEGILEGIQDLLAKATTDLAQVPPIILANYLPPPHDLGLPIVRLMNHPHYQTYQAHIAALSLVGNLSIKYVPPAWNALPPATPLPGASNEVDDNQQRDEWKRRIRMYLGPVVEAFGYERIIFGSSPSPGSHHPSHVGDWYEIAREALAELGVEQGYVEAIFYGNAGRVYGA